MQEPLNLDIPVLWYYVRQVRESVYNYLQHYSEDFREAACMVASELVANAIHYGENLAQALIARCSLSIVDSQLCIEVTNGTTNVAHLKIVHDRINQINGAEDKEQLYAERLQDLLSGNYRHGQLGLYRVGCEGKFTLSYEYSNNILKVKATRRLP